MAAPAGGGGGACARPAGRTDFPAFPYPPYDIQLGFMSTLYSALDAGGVGLFESPTGTGKTLSLICGSLQWLHDQRQREAAEAAAAAARVAAGGSNEQPPAGAAGDSDDDAPDWMRDFGEEQERQRQQQLLERQQQRIARAKAKLLGAGGSRLGGGAKPGGGGRRAGAARTAGVASDDPDAEFLMDEWQSDGEDSAAAGGPGSARKRGPGAAGLRLVLDSSGSDSEGGSGAEGLGEVEEVEAPRKRQIIFASRTHSQLSQFVGELHRTPFADEMSLVALGSRKALCINESVLALGAPSLINERCLDLQKPGSSGSKKAAVAAAAPAGGSGTAGPQARKAAGGRCPYLASGSQAAATTRDMILAHPIDIEELAKLGRRKSVCPYYSARRAVPEADIILAPYSCLLVKETREALGLRLEGNVVIVDEGHNLVDAINSSHAAELTEAAATAAHRQLSAYFQRFQSRLAPGNCRHIQTLARCAQVLSRAASGAQPLTPSSAPGGSGSSSATSAGGSGSGAAASGGAVLTVNDFLLQTGLDNLNLFKLVSYVRESKAVYKIAGFWQAEHKRAAAKAAGPASAADGSSTGAAAGGAAAEVGGTGPLHALVSFLQALTSVDADGRIVVQPQQQVPPPPPPQQQRAGASSAGYGGSAPGRSGGGGDGGGLLKFVLLNAAAHFGAVVSAAHAVVLASGTLSPLESVLHLFPGLPPHRLHRFSCGHVVARERLLALAVGAGPSGAALDFRHASRGSSSTIDELGRLVLNACQVVPGGVVVFFPSFSYADQVHARWQASGLLRQLAARKRVFREPRSAAEVEACLADYAACIEAATENRSSSSSSGGGGGGSSSGGKAVVALGSAGKPAASAGHAENSSGNQGGGGAGSVLSVLSGAVMLCVVGGKLAEGINFGDALGRCVIMVGLPYPNPSDPELQERMRFMDRQAASSAPGAGGAAAGSEAGAAAVAGSAGAAGSTAATPAATAAAQGGMRQAPPPAQHPAHAQQAQQQCGTALKLEDGREYYSNLCMKAVNQCIGRVIRHHGDWASVLLVDARYATAVDSRGQLSGPLAKLPGWIQQSLQVPRGFGDAFGKLARFSRTMAAAEAGAAAAQVAAAPAAAAAAAVLAPG